MSLAIFISFIIGALSLLLGITLSNALFGPRLARAPMPVSRPRVSVLVPARNEAAHLPACLHDLLQQDYPDFEIIVLDDHSTDGTAAVVQEYQKRDARVHYLAGRPLPQNWLGKNWACHQLSRHAGGDLMIFTDADLRYAPRAISQTVGWMQRLELGMLTAFSQPLTKSFAEKVIVPVLDLLVYSYLPLWLTYLSPRPSLSAAHGHWLAFMRTAYERIGGHAAVRAHAVEDVALARLAKRRGIKMLTVAGTGAIWGRMYENLRGIWRGYSKNLFGLMGFRAAPFFAALALLLSLHVMPYVLLFPAGARLPAAIALGLNVLLRLVLALRFGHPLFIGILFHPLGILAVAVIAVNSYRWFKAGKGEWKGRRFSLRAIHA